ncbi:hypothetical protein EZI54_07195 [Marinobacter halodurans]|uniref:Uncharacterized protein n=1 Tax=Marinobacter halodurans TaxID=2528979 RepID=A0ABY1ZMH1_9GAMM|nr:hypothetical protein [Marinobacter halodurans]TBW57437.1 hypothetical protein EZI54_07195 [Marinobacter halodurans]
MYQINQRREDTKSPAPKAEPSSGGGQASNLFAQARQTVENHKELHGTAGATLNAQKIMGSSLEPVLAFHSLERQKEEEPVSDAAFLGRIEERQRDFLTFVGEQAKSLRDRLANTVAEIDEPWVKARLTSTVADYVGQYYRYVGPEVFTMDLAEQLSNAHEIEGIWTQTSLNRDHNEHRSPEAVKAEHLLNAMSPVIAAYQRFDYFQPDRNETIQRLADLIASTVDETLGQHPAVDDMSERDQQALRGNLLYRAGRTLQECWVSQVRETLDTIREMPTDERRDVMAQGYPLNNVEAHFLSHFQMIQQTTLIALTQHSGIDMDESAVMDSEPSMNM